MSTKPHHSESAAKTVAQFSLKNNTELHVELVADHEQQNISLQIYRKSATGEIIAAEQNIELPVELLTELKRSIDAAERAISDNTPITAHNKVATRPLVADFAHESEQEFARILDFYQIEWYYEPCTFAIRWDEQGKVVESFTPDFYLPEFDQYIEMTTLKQGLVTKKNRKVRLLRELHPEINIKIMYGRDYKKLLEKYTRRPLSEINGLKSETAPSDH